AYGRPTVRAISVSSTSRHQFLRSKTASSFSLFSGALALYLLSGRAGRPPAASLKSDGRSPDRPGDRTPKGDGGPARQAKRAPPGGKDDRHGSDGRSPGA